MQKKQSCAREAYRRFLSRYLHPGTGEPSLASSAALLQFHLMPKPGNDIWAASLMSLIQGETMHGLGVASASHKR